MSISGIGHNYYQNNMETAVITKSANSTKETN